MRRRSPPALAALLILAGAGRAAAQEAPAVDVQRIEIRGVAANDTEQRRREPVAKTVYGREELDKYGDVSVTDVLKRLPGINLSGGNPRLRGLGAGYTLILINGEPAPPGFSLENLPPSQVERIEVTKGPTAEYSAQAVAGTINVVLRAAPRQRQRELGLRLGYSAQRPVPGLNATLADRFGDLSVSLPFSAFQWAGGADNDSRRASRDLQGEPQTLAVGGVDRWWGGGINVGPRFSWRPTGQATIESQTFVQRNEFNGTGHFVSRVLAGGDPLSLDDRYRNSGHWQMVRTGVQFVRRFDEGARLEASVGVQSSDSAFLTKIVGLDRAGTQSVDRVVSGGTSEQSRSSKGKFTRPLMEAHTLAVGWDLEARRRREVREQLDFGESQLKDFEREPFRARIDRRAAYVQDEWEIAPQWSTYLGLRAESITTTSRSSVDGMRSRSAVVTPVIHLNYKLDPKGRDLIRASVTRSYKAPELGALMARPVPNNTYPLNTSNTEASADRVGNPGLKPELATGLDLAFEKYLDGGGVMSVGVFQRRISALIRNAITLENVSWSTAPRWIAHPINLEGARSTGIEFEIKGRARELLPAGLLPGELNLRASLSAYRSQVAGIPRPYNRLEQQQPWALTAGFDHRWAGTPLGLGASLAFTPGYITQQTVAASWAQNRARNLDGYVSWAFSKDALFRLSVNNAAPVDVVTLARTVEGSGYVLASDSVRRNRPNWNAGLTLKF